MLTKGKILILSCAAIACLSGCSGEEKWTVKGEVANAGGRTLILEGSNLAGKWYVIDSVAIDKSGRFEFAQPPAGFPDIYRLNLGGQTIYFPIDSVETVSVRADARDFTASCRVSGSELARTMAAVDSLSAAAPSNLKEQLVRLVVDDRSGLIGYYIINKKVNGELLFNPKNKQDLRLIGAVANAYASNRPNDPRTPYLRNLYLSSRKAFSNRVDTLEASEIRLIDFSFPDDKGTLRSLSDLTSKGKVVLLNFTLFDADPSPAFNLRLSEIYNANRDKGLEIVQVALDNDRYAWARAAKALPWITLFATEKERADVALKYNLVNIPSTFIINRSGELVERVDDVDKLSSALHKYL